MASPTPYVPGFPSGSLLQLRTYITYRSQLAINTFYHWVPAGPSTGVYGDLAASWGAVMSAVYSAFCTSGATYYGCSVKAFLSYTTHAIWTQPVYSANGQGLCSGGTTPAPTQACGLSSVSTAVAGPSGRGRTYWPFPDQSQIATSTGLFNVAGLAAIQALNDTWTGRLASYLVTLAVTGGSLTVAPALHKYGSNVYYPITSSTVRAGVATQRKRGTNFGRTNGLPF